MDIIAYALANSKFEPRADGAFGWNIDKGLRKWRHAKARLDNNESEIINLNFIGDSITEGYKGSATTEADYSSGFINVLRTAFETAYEDVGKGFIGNRYPVGVVAGNRRFVYTGTWTTTGVAGWATSLNCIAKTTTVNDSCTFTWTGTGITVLVEGSTSGGTAAFVIDGGAEETLNMAAASSSIKEYTKTGLADAEHTIVISLKTAGRLSLHGAYALKGTSGVRVNNLGSSGLTSVAHTTYALNMISTIDYWTPKLTVISLGANDFNTQVALDTFEANLQTLITRALTFGDVMLTNIGGNYDKASPTILQSEYNNIIKKLAISNECAFVDITKRQGETHAVADSIGYLADIVHPNAEGHRDIANVLIKILLEQ